MPNIPSGVTMFKVYDATATQLLGLAKIKTPDINMKTATASGAGLSGDVEFVFRGQTEAMEMTMDFYSQLGAAQKLATPEWHTLTIKSAEDETDGATAKIIINKVKYVVVVMPKKLSGAEIAAASMPNVSGTYSVRRFEKHINGKMVTCVDPINNSYVVDGVDYLADVLAAVN